MRRGNQYNRRRDVSKPFDAVPVIAFGGPQAQPDVRPFLENVLRGRRVAPGRIEEVAHHYDVVGGRSPLTELTTAQAEGLADRLSWPELPFPSSSGCATGIRTHRYARADVASRRPPAVGFIAAAHRSYSSCTVRENVQEARAALARAGLPDVEVTCMPRLVQPRALRRRERSVRVVGTRQGRADAATARNSCSRRTAFPNRWPLDIHTARSSRKPHGWWPNAHGPGGVMPPSIRVVAGALTILARP